MKNIILLIIYFTASYFMLGINAFIGIPLDHVQQPWAMISNCLFFCIVLGPVVGLLLIYPSFWKTIDYKVKIQKIFNYVLVVVPGLLLVYAMSIPSDTNIRVDALAIVFSLLVTFCVVAINIFNIAMANRNLNN